MAREVGAIKVLLERNAEEDLKAARKASILHYRQVEQLVKEALPYYIEQADNAERAARAFQKEAHEHRELVDGMRLEIADLQAKLKCAMGKYGREKQLREAAEAKLAQAEKVQERFDGLAQQIENAVDWVIRANENIEKFESMAAQAKQERSDMQDTLLLEIWKASDNGYKTADLHTSNRLADIFTAAAMAARGGMG